MGPLRRDPCTGARFRSCVCFLVDGNEDDVDDAMPSTRAFPKTQRATGHSSISSLQKTSASPILRPLLLPDTIVWAVFKMLKQDDHDLRSYQSALCVNKQFARIGSSLLRPQRQCPALPDELLLEIFSAVRFNASSSDAASDLAASLRVCRQWYRAGMPLLYKHFVMDCNYKLALGHGQNSHSPYRSPAARNSYDFIPSARFFDTATRLWARPWTVAGLGSWIHSLSIEIHFYEDQVDQKHRHSITDIVSELPNLMTLSLRAAPLRQANWIRHKKFATMIAQIPRTIRNFELDLQSRDSLYDNTSISSQPLCQALATIIPQLQTLRLRLSSMCALFLRELIHNEHKTRVWPNLKSVSISLYNRDFTPQTTCCNFDSNVISLPRSYFMDSLQGFLTDETLFPNLKACSLICLRDDMAAPGTMTKRIICNNFDPQLRIWSKRAYYPYLQGFSQPFYFRTDEDGDETESCMQGWNDRDFAFNSMPCRFPNKLTHSRATDELFEGAAVWTEDAIGARYPPRI